MQWLRVARSAKGASQLASLLVAVRRPEARWREPLFVLLDAVAILLMLYMHAAQGPLDHVHSLTPAGLVVTFILLML